MGFPKGFIKTYSIDTPNSSRKWLGESFEVTPTSSTVKVAVLVPKDFGYNYFFVGIALQINNLARILSPLADYKSPSYVGNRGITVLSLCDGMGRSCLRTHVMVSGS